ncbi:MAG: exo-alpha-sialidase [Chloroflexi bacterium]|nr:exo-alpha-sialidase [Chloroflexota bacterium]
MQKRILNLLIIIIIAGFAAPVPRVSAEGGTEWDTPMRIPSPAYSNSWFPDVAVDRQENVHVIWSETGDFGAGIAASEALMYSVWNGSQWSQFTDIVPPQADIIRSAMTIAADDTIHVVFDSDPPFSLYYKSVPASSAYSAARWGKPVVVNGREHTYMSDIVSWGSNLHVVYDDGQFYEKECAGCADIFYRSSPNNGLTWSEPVVLLNTKMGSARSQIEVDGAGNLYVTWDEGWDRLTGLGSADHGIFMLSRDQGQTWSVPLLIEYPNNTNIQLTPAGDGKGGVMLVWRTISPNYPAVYYSWSGDWGQTWTLPQTLPNIASSQLENSFDIYDMAVDASGHIHLVATGYLASNRIESADFSNPPGLFHFEWDGEKWSLPQLIFQSNWYPLYPKISISHGNQLYVVWHMREDIYSQKDYHQLWFAHGTSSAEYIEENISEAAAQGTSVAINTPTPEPPATTPTLFPVSSEPMRGNPFSEIDEYLILLVGIIPAAILIWVVMSRKSKNS